MLPESLFQNVDEAIQEKAIQAQMDEFRTLWESENGQQMACIIAYGVGLLPTHEGENNTIVEASLRLAESQIPTDKTIAMYLLENIYKGRNAAMQLNDTSQNDI